MASPVQLHLVLWRSQVVLAHTGGLRGAFALRVRLSQSPDAERAGG